MGVLVQIDAGKRWKLGGLLAEFGERIYTLIVARVLFAALFLVFALSAQQAKQASSTSSTAASASSSKAQEQQPPEEDESYKPREYSFNPVQAVKEMTAGNYYFSKHNYRAARSRYLEATRWDPGSAEAFLKLGESNEKLHNLSAARDAYAKYLQIDPGAKEAKSIRKRMAKWPGDSASVKK
jgi:tetratricopeptide (TPR) repeat protein